MHDKQPGELLIGAHAIAEFLGCSQRQVYRLSSEKIIPTFKLGGAIAARRTTIEKCIDEMEAKA